jgi:hypothetical protein
VRTSSIHHIVKQPISTQSARPKAKIAGKNPVVMARRQLPIFMQSSITLLIAGPAPRILVDRSGARLSPYRSPEGRS